MKLNRRFYDDSINFRNIPIERVVIAIVLGLATAFTIYGFMYLLRESFRLMSHGFGYLPNILNEFERNAYNWFFAVVSLIFGNSIALSIILSGSHKVFEKRNFKRRIIINNQAVLNGSFAFWSLKIAYILGVYSMSFTDFNFSHNNIYLILLLLTVLYLETWKTLSLTLGKNKFKYMQVHFLVLLVFSFGLSKIEFINYKKIDANQLKYTPLINLPQSEYQNVTYFDNHLNVYLDSINQDKLLFGYYENYLNDSYLDFLDYKSKMYRGFRKTASIRICADRDTKMEVIRSIESEVKKADINYIIYGTFEDDLYATRFSRSGIKIKLKDSSYYEDGLLKEFYAGNNYFFKVESNLSVKNTLKVEIRNSIIIGGQVVPKNILAKKMESYINQNTVFEYRFSADTKYQDYISVLSAHLKAIELIREKNKKVKLIWDNDKYSYTNEAQFIRDQQRLRDEFPFRITQRLN